MIVNNTISLNTLAGISCFGADDIIINSIIWGNTSSFIFLGPNSDPILSYNCIEGGFPSQGVNNGGNIYDDPLFFDPNIGDYHLTENSPCINAGTPDTTGLHLPPFDLDGNPRIYNGIIDMGCYEWQGVGVDDWHSQSKDIVLYQNCPNPFSTSTTISFNIHPRLLGTKNAEIEIYNIKGQLVKQLSIFNSQLNWEQSSIKWDGKDENGKSLSSGIYFYCLETDNYESEIKKMILIK